MGRLTNDRLFSSGPAAALESLGSYAPASRFDSDGAFDRHLQDAGQQQSASPPHVADRSASRASSESRSSDEQARPEPSAAVPEQARQPTHAAPESTNAAAPAEVQSDNDKGPPAPLESSEVDKHAAAAVAEALAGAAAVAANAPAKASPTAEVSADVAEKSEPQVKPTNSKTNKQPTGKSDAPVKPTSQETLAAKFPNEPAPSAAGPAEKPLVDAKGEIADGDKETANDAEAYQPLAAQSQSQTGSPKEPASQIVAAAAAANVPIAAEEAPAAASTAPATSKIAATTPQSTRRGRQEASPLGESTGATAPVETAVSETAPVAAVELPPDVGQRDGKADAQPDGSFQQPPEATAPANADTSAATTSTAAPPKGLAASIASGASHRSPHGMEISEADRARFVQRVAHAFQSVGDDGGQLRLRLSPPELGSMRLEITVNKGVLAAHVEAETPQARQLLLDNLPALRERLQEQNIKVERFDVDVAGQSSSGWSRESAQQRQQDNQARNANLRTRAAAAPEAVSPRGAAARPVTGDGKLNVVI
jgi:flagellar hook-length control protein FliK